MLGGGTGAFQRNRQSAPLQIESLGPAETMGARRAEWLSLTELTDLGLGRTFAGCCEDVAVFCLIAGKPLKDSASKC